MTTVVILQSNYIPWRGYFDLIRRADHFIFYDTVQFTKNDWRNRNRIVGPGGPLWLTLPVQTAGRLTQRIDDTFVSDPDWASKHLSTLRNALGKAPLYRSHLAPLLKNWYGEIGAETNLSAINRFLIRAVMTELGLATVLHNSVNLPQEGDRTGRLVSMCQALGATRYLSGPSAKDYMDLDQFAVTGIEVEWMSYPPYPAYSQMNGSYEPGISVLDAMAHLQPGDVLG